MGTPIQKALLPGSLKPKNVWQTGNVSLSKKRRNGEYLLDKQTHLRNFSHPVVCVRVTNDILY